MVNQCMDFYGEILSIGIYYAIPVQVICMEWRGCNWLCSRWALGHRNRQDGGERHSMDRTYSGLVGGRSVCVIADNTRRVRSDIGDRVSHGQDSSNGMGTVTVALSAINVS